MARYRILFPLSQTFEIPSCATIFVVTLFVHRNRIAKYFNLRNIYLLM